MQDIELVTPKAINLEWIENFLRKAPWKISTAELGEQICIECSNQRAMIDPVPDHSETLEAEGVLDRVLTVVPNPNFFILSWAARDVALARRVVACLLENPDFHILVHEDSHLIRKEEFLRRCEENPDWQFWTS